MRCMVSQRSDLRSVDLDAFLRQLDLLSEIKGKPNPEMGRTVVGQRFLYSKRNKHEHNADWTA